VVSRPQLDRLFDMLFSHRTFWLPKDVQEPTGYEDAFEVDEISGRAAICDGVSTSLFSGRWASILAKAVVQNPPDLANESSLEDWLKRQRDAWSATIDEHSLAWHQKPKLLEGAGSTLLWVEVSGSDAADGVARPRRLRCYSIGDCCLFHIRGGQVLETFPVQESTRFDENPRVIRSVFKRSEHLEFEAMEAQCHPGDLLVLASDAIACWTMRQIEAGVEVDWQAYWQLSREQWQQWTVELRQDHQIRYDDATVILLRISGESPRTGQPSSRSVEDLLGHADTAVRGALKSIKGGLRRGLKELADSKWLSDKRPK
jgi:serine/threonine protein phosphatase PrpC